MGQTATEKDFLRNLES